MSGMQIPSTTQVTKPNITAEMLQGRLDRCAQPAGSWKREVGTAVLCDT